MSYLEEHFEGTSSSGVRIMLDSYELFKKLEAAEHKIVKSPFDAFWGQRYATVMDPDGNRGDLFASLS